jgi:hypothetical protein
LKEDCDLSATARVARPVVRDSRSFVCARTYLDFVGLWSGTRPCMSATSVSGGVGNEAPREIFAPDAGEDACYDRRDFGEPAVLG